jgi:predicted nuclease of predicted toxin-antitoxin system
MAGRERGDAIHVLDLSLETTPDLDIWKHATREQRIVISKGEDF